jgi:hypothetical protein
MPDPSFVLPLLLQSVLVPAAACAVLLLILLRAGGARRDWAAPVAIAGGFLASMAATYHAQWSFPPHQALDWMPLVLALALCAIAVEPRGAWWSRLLLSALVAAVVAWPALGSAGAAMTLATVAVMALLMTGIWTALASAAQRPAAPLALTLAAGGAGLALMIDASQLIGQLCGALGVAVAVCGLLRLRAGFGTAAVGASVLLLGAMLGYARIYAGFGLPMMALLLAALLAEPLLTALRRRPAPTLPAALLIAMPVLAAIGLAVRAMQESGGY